MTRLCPFIDQPGENVYCPQCGAVRHAPLADRAGQPVRRVCPAAAELHPPPSLESLAIAAGIYPGPGPTGCCPNSPPAPELPAVGGVWIASG